jgi:hypothetical protein
MMIRARDQAEGSIRPCCAIPWWTSRKRPKGRLAPKKFLRLTLDARPPRQEFVRREVVCLFRLVFNHLQNEDPVGCAS